MVNYSQDLLADSMNIVGSGWVDWQDSEITVGSGWLTVCGWDNCWQRIWVAADLVVRAKHSGMKLW